MQLLPPTTGKNLPVEVREALLELGASCNDAAILLSLTAGVGSFTNRRFENVLALSQSRQAADDMTLATRGWHNRAIAVFARAATRYAVSASNIAAAVAASKAPEAPAVDHLLPSMLAVDFDQLLPANWFTGDCVVETDTADSIATLLWHRDALKGLIFHRLHGGVLDAYDDLQVDGSVDMTAELPLLLHRFATEMVFVLGLVSGAEDPDL